MPYCEKETQPMKEVAINYKYNGSSGSVVAGAGSSNRRKGERRSDEITSAVST